MPKSEVLYILVAPQSPLLCEGLKSKMFAQSLVEDIGTRFLDARDSVRKTKCTFRGVKPTCVVSHCLPVHSVLSSQTHQSRDSDSREFKKVCSLEGQSLPLIRHSLDGLSFISTSSSSGRAEACPQWILEVSGLRHQTEAQNPLRWRWY